MAANIGISPPDFTTDVGRIRRAIGDTDATDVVSGSGTYLFFSDAELSSLALDWVGHWRYAAAEAIDTIAATQVLLLKVFSANDLMVQGDRVGKALLQRAAVLRATEDKLNQSILNSGFNIVDTTTTWGWGPFGPIELDGTAEGGAHTVVFTHIFGGIYLVHSLALTLALMDRFWKFLAVWDCHQS